jgi:hypothetical protein
MDFSFFWIFGWLGVGSGTVCTNARYAAIGSHEKLVRHFVASLKCFTSEKYLITQLK